MTTRHRPFDSELAPLADPGPVALVDDDPLSRRLMRGWLEASGLKVIEYETGSRVLDELPPEASAVCLDLGLEDMPGLHVLRHLRAHDPDLPVLVVTAKRDLETAVECMRVGAHDYLAKPLDRPKLTESIARAMARHAAVCCVRQQQRKAAEAQAPPFVGKSPPIRLLWRQIERVLESDATVCIFGESGTGKEVVARSLHEYGRRRRGPFVAVNCAAIPATLLENDLFGHEKGAFTGAHSAHRGKFEQAQGGTLFLDELGEMSASAQAALLRTIQERTIRRIGGSSEIPLDVRIVCATHRDLNAAVKRGMFREDLYYRLVVYPIHIPPLRERPEDIPLLVGHFLRKLQPDTGREIRGVSNDVLDALCAHSWLGNVRELQNVIHRAMLTCDGDQIELRDLPLELRERALLAPTATAPLPATAQAPIVPLGDNEQQAICRALSLCGGSVPKAAKMLGISRATLYRRLPRLTRQDA